MKTKNLLLLTGKNGKRCIFNVDHIVYVDYSSQDDATVIGLVGRTAYVSESVEEVWKKLSGGSQ